MGPIATLRRHLPEYLAEAAGLGLFMVSAGAFGTLLESLDSPVRAAISDDFTRRVLMGAAMGLTAIAIIYSPWGRRSGAHINPATTLTFWRLGKVATWDAACYMVFQAAGGIVGTIFIGAILQCDFL
jgi:aquaporin Z